MEFINITRYLDKTDYKDILVFLNEKKIFYSFIKLVIEQINTLNNKKIEFIIKIILHKIIYFDGNVSSEDLELFYKKIEEINDSNLNILNDFISLYDKFNQFRSIFISLNFQLINIFKKKFNDFYDFYTKKNLTKDDLKDIKTLIENKVIIYFNSFFETNYNNVFFKRITDCKNKITQDINTEEMIKRLISLKELFTLNFLEKLEVKTITIDEFLDMEYNKRVSYYRIFYIKTFNLFKNYFKLYDYLNYLQDEINNIIKIDPLNYIESLYDSSSSFILSEDNLEIEMNKFEENEQISIFNFENSYEEIEYECSSSDEDDKVDTPYISIHDVAPFAIVESNGASNSSSESYGNNSDSLSDEDELSDIFIKEKKD